MPGKQGGNSGSFKPGQSGNPKGRPRTGQSLAEYIRRCGGDNGRAYVDTLHALAVGAHDNPSIRLTALKTLLEHGYGKPKEQVEHSGEINLPIRVVHEYHEATSS